MIRIPGNLVEDRHSQMSDLSFMTELSEASLNPRLPLPPPLILGHLYDKGRPKPASVHAEANSITVLDGEDEDATNDYCPNIGQGDPFPDSSHCSDTDILARRLGGGGPGDSPWIA